MAGLNTQGAYFDNVASTAAASAGVSPGHWRVYTKTDGVFAIDSTSAEYKLNSLPEAKAYTDAASGALQLQIDAFTGGVTGMTAYTNLTPVEVPLGGVQVGDTFTGASIKYMFDRLLYPYLAPAFTSFSMAAQPLSLEVGDSTLANRTFNWSISHIGNVQGNTINITDVTTLTPIATGITGSSYASSIAAVTSNIPTVHTWGIQATNTEAGTFNDTVSVSWQWRVYAGTSSNPTVTSQEISAMAFSVLTSTAARTYSFGAGGYKYIVVPQSILPQPTVFTDQQTNFNVAMDLTLTPVTFPNAFGKSETYNVYRTTNVLGSSINIVVA